jgi:hypothetical protein
MPRRRGDTVPGWSPEGSGWSPAGAAIGLMGVIADAVLRLGGEVIGVIPQRLVSRDLAHTG